MSVRYSRKGRPTSFDIQASKAFQYIKENGTVYKFVLMEFVGMSVSTFEKFKPWFLFKFGKEQNYSEYVEYIIPSKEFKYHKEEQSA